MRPVELKNIEMNFKSMILWVLAGLAVAGLCFWMIATPGPPATRTIGMVLYVLATLATAIGTFWMWYMAVRHEPRPLLFILLAFIPFTFLWYYFERVRPDRRTSTIG
jgi:hypothetical protein